MLLNRNKELKIDNIEECEDWMIYNKYILTGYRINFDSKEKCWKSIFMMHNETMNIWIHILGFLFFLIILILFSFGLVFDFHNKNNENNDKINNLNRFTIYIFYFTSLVCLTLSTVYHTFMAIGVEMDRKLQKLDFLGIFVLIFGSCLPVYYTSFYCQYNWFIIYSIMIFLTCIGSYFLFYVDSLHTDKYKYLKAIIFLIISFLIAAPIIHILVNFYIFKDKNALEFSNGLNYVAYHGLVYISGMFIYTLRVPERFVKYKFDYFFNSHNIWHIMIVIACYINYIGVNELFKNREIKLCI